MKEITNPDQYLKQTITLKTELEKTFIILAERLYNIFSQRLWEKQYQSWDEFLIELKLNSPTASKLMSVYKKYVLECKIPISKLVAVRSWESLYTVRSLATSQESALDLVEAGAVQTNRDMRAMVKNVDCDGHEWYEVRICKNCGLKEKVYPDETPENDLLRPN